MKNKYILSVASAAFFISSFIFSGIIAQAFEDYALWFKEGCHGMYKLTIVLIPPEIIKSALILVGHIVLFFSLTAFIFRKKDILS